MLTPEQLPCGNSGLYGRYPIQLQIQRHSARISFQGNEIEKSNITRYTWAVWDTTIVGVKRLGTFYASRHS